MKMNNTTLTYLSLCMALGCSVLSLYNHKRYRSELENLHKQILALKPQEVDNEAVITSLDTDEVAADMDLPSDSRYLSQVEDNEAVITSLDTENFAADLYSPSDSRYTMVKGVVGDGVTDDTRAIQRAINRAAANKNNGVVVLPKGVFLTKKRLMLKGGVTLRGQGYGSSPLAIQFDAGGSVIAYCGTDYAIKITGHAASLENLAVYDWRYPVGSHCDQVKAAGGVIVTANNKGVESVTMRNVLIYWFMGGTALTLEATNGGGIAYSSMENIRIRHAKVGIHLSADESSFANSNSFHDGAISGGITDVGVLVNGPGACNDNKFNGMVIEPPSTNIAHVHVSGAKSNVRMNNVRLEGTNMNQTQPLVIIEDDSYANVMNGLLGHTFVKADFNKNPGITFASNKMVGIHPAPHNQIWNAALNGVNVNDPSLPGWSIDGASTSFEILSLDEALYADHNVLRIHYLGDGSSFKLKPIVPSNRIHSFCTFGVYARSSTPSSISAAMKGSSGSVISSSSHTGSGDWEFIGLSSKFSKEYGHQAYFSITGSVDISAPTFTYGYSSATPGAELISSSGARMAGLFTTNMIEVAVPEGGGYWVLPREGNLFKISPISESSPPCTDTYVTITRINYSGADRFPTGTTITLLFPTCGGCVPCLSIKDSSYIHLLGETNFAPPPSSPNSSLTLVSRGFGVWLEVSRNSI